MYSSAFLNRLNLRVPLIVAPMAGGPSSTELVVAACEAGALGAIGAAYSKPKAIEEFMNKVRAQTKGVVAINLFIPHEQPQVSETQVLRAIRATEKFRDELSLPQLRLESPYEENFDEQFEMLLKLKPEVFSFVFGLLKSEYVRSAKKESILLLGTATSVEEALALQDSGVDAITLQGCEAGGHRGIFDPNRLDPETSILDLLGKCRGKISIPIIAAGGIMNSQDIKNIMSKGAQAVQMGTAFLACEEAGTSAPYRKALLLTKERKTKTTRAFSGRLARGMENRFMREMDVQPEAILPFPAQNKFTRDIRGASAKINSSEFLSLWCGTGQSELWTGSAQGLIDALFGIKAQKPNLGGL